MFVNICRSDVGMKQTTDCAQFAGPIHRALRLNYPIAHSAENQLGFQCCVYDALIRWWTRLCSTHVECLLFTAPPQHDHLTTQGFEHATVELMYLLSVEASLLALQVRAVKPSLDQADHAQLYKYYAAVRMRQSYCMAELNAQQIR